MFEHLRRALTPGTKVPVDQVPVGGGVVLDHGPYVVTQAEPGRFCAFRKNCPHTGRPVDRVEGNSIICDAHGSKFAATTGEPTKGPARTPPDARQNQPHRRNSLHHRINTREQATAG